MASRADVRKWPQDRVCDAAILNLSQVEFLHYVPAAAQQPSVKGCRHHPSRVHAQRVRRLFSNALATLVPTSIASPSRVIAKPNTS